MVRFTLHATTVASMLLAGSLYGTSAFAPVHRSQSAFLAPSIPLPRAASTSSSTLHMNLFDRFQRVAKSNLNNILQNLEDPEKIMNQAVEDMQVSSSYCRSTSSSPRKDGCKSHHCTRNKNCVYFF
jgi:hypothetical protein